MRLALGTVQFGLCYGIANSCGQTCRDEAAAMTRLAAEAGMDTLDTAVGYGESESCLGAIGVAGFRVVTKLHELPETCPDVCAWARAELAGSLDRLNLPGVHGLLLHRPAQLLGPRGDELYRALRELKDAGLTRKIGVSIYAPAELDEIMGRFPMDLVQAPFNLVDRRLAASGWLARLAEAGVEVHARSCFLQGLLLMAPQDRPGRFAPWAHLWARWDAWLAESGVSPLRACLGFSLSQPGIGRVLVGAESTAQLAEIIACAAAPAPGSFPDLGCGDENLVNPSRWSLL